MREMLELPRLSLRERDRRWEKVRELMERNGLECLVLFGFPCKWDYTLANARFLSQIGGNAAFNIMVFPLRGEPTCFILMPTFLEYWKRAQDWVRDIRVRKGNWADSIASRIRELDLGKKNIGIDGLESSLDPDGWVPFSVYSRLRDILPDCNFVNIGDMLERVRAIKSAEEIEFLETAARLGDRMLEACAVTARPGVSECAVYGKMMETMLANGGEEPTLFLWASDEYPLPHPFRLPTERPLQKGDLIICEMHPKYAGYLTHVERTFSLGKPKEEYLRIYEGCLEAYHKGMELFKPGESITKAMNAVKETIKKAGLEICEAGIHGHGLSSQEYPRYRHHAREADLNAVKFMEDELRPGMVFAFNIDLFDPRWRNGETGCVFAETVLITDSGSRRLHSFDIGLQVI